MAHTNDLADHLCASRLPTAAGQVRTLVGQMEIAAAAALGINVTKLRGREPLKRQVANMRPRRQETYPSLPVRSPSPLARPHTHALHTDSHRARFSASNEHLLHLVTALSIAV